SSSPYNVYTVSSNSTRVHARASLFTYTTLFRYLAVRRNVREPVMLFIKRDLFLLASVRAHPPDLHVARALGVEINVFQLRAHGRSEEHTSELQSHLNLVCRILLEKNIDNIYAIL